MAGTTATTEKRFFEYFTDAIIVHVFVTRIGKRIKNQLTLSETINGPREFKTDVIIFYTSTYVQQHE